MLNLDKVINIYADKIAHGVEVDSQELCLQIPEEEREEFLELADFVKLTMAAAKEQEFMTFFENLNDYKEQIYTSNTVVNFHGQKDAVHDVDMIEKMFDEEFGEDEWNK